MPKQSWTIGSDPTCDLVVENVTVSGIHCRLEQVGETFKLEDLKSSNGTYVDGQRLEGSATVSRKDRITLGQTLAMPWPPVAADTELQVITIGRAPKNILVIDESNVSSVHAQITISKNQIVLEDLGSTNGTSVGKVENKINRATVKMGDTVFLGSTAYVVSDLISRTNVNASNAPTKPAPAIEAKQMRSGNSDASKNPGRSSNALIKIGLAALGGLILALVVWIMLPSSDSDSKKNGFVVSTSQKTNKSNSDNHVPSSDLTETSEDENGKATEDQPTPLTDSEKLSRSLFLLVCSDEKGEMRFRVATAFAIDSKYVATSASAISIMEDLQKNGFPKAYLYHPESKKEIEFVSTRVHPQYEIANDNARRAQQDHDGMMDELESNPPNPDAFESVKKKLLAARLKAIESLELKTTCDVGVVEVGQPLEHWLEGIESTKSLRPKLKLSVTGFAHDIEDPFFDVAFPIELSTMPSRVNRISKWSNDALQRLEATGLPTQMENSYLGSPAINAQGKVVAIYSRPVPPGNSPGELIESGEATAVAEFDAPLFIRVRECLENRP